MCRFVPSGFRTNPPATGTQWAANFRNSLPRALSDLSSLPMVLRLLKQRHRERDLTERAPVVLQANSIAPWLGEDDVQELHSDVVMRQRITRLDRIQVASNQLRCQVRADDRDSEAVGAAKPRQSDVDRERLRLRWECLRVG